MYNYKVGTTNVPRSTVCFNGMFCKSLVTLDRLYLSEGQSAPEIETKCAIKMSSILKQNAIFLKVVSFALY